MLVVKGWTISGLSLNWTRKNSSSGLAVLKNWAAARRAFWSLAPMEPEASKTRPTERGASSLAKVAIFCSDLSSKSLKCSASRPVTKRLSGSVTVTLIRTRLVSTRMLAGREARGSGSSAGPVLRRGAAVVLLLVAGPCEDEPALASAGRCWGVFSSATRATHNNSAPMPTKREFFLMARVDLSRLKSNQMISCL